MSDAAPIVITDALGRKLTIIPLQPHEMLDLFEAAGANSGNASWVRMAMVVSSVRQIDTTPLPYPVKKEQVRENAKRLGNEGLAAASIELMGDPTAEAPPAAEVDAQERETAKN